MLPSALSSRLGIPAALMSLSALASCADVPAPEAPDSSNTESTAVRMGNYEVVLDWPQGLPDAFPGEHDGWTWGSSSGVWAESPDKVWLGQRGEIADVDYVNP